MRRIAHKAKSFKDADDWDVQQYLSMTPDERRKIAMMLKKKVYGKISESIRSGCEVKKITLK
jgi:hypothetical protein